MSSVALVAGSLLVLLAVFAGLVWFFQERVAFQPPHGPWPSDAGISRVDYEASDRQHLFAYLVGNPAFSRGLLITFHGNADLAVRQVEWAQEVARRTGMAVMLTEYRGYMGLPGRPSYEGSQLDAEAAYHFAADSLGIPESRMAFFGHSLGSAIAAELAVKHRPAVLILESPFTSAQDMARRIIGWRPSDVTWGLLSRLYFDTGAKVAHLDCPVSVSHGDRDRLIPLAMGRSVYQTAKVKGEWLEVRGASHSDVSATGREEYWTWISKALDPVDSTISTDEKRARR
ncbi:MAG: alpha/beta hydrolase [Gemmatimonadales bacterium]